MNWIHRLFRRIIAWPMAGSADIIHSYDDEHASISRISMERFSCDSFNSISN